jgi:hypothetical protein
MARHTKNVDWHIDLGSVRTTVWRPDPDFFYVITRVPPKILETLGAVPGAVWAIRVAVPIFAGHDLGVWPDPVLEAGDHRR